MDPIEILMKEHRMIERVMDALMSYVEEMMWKPRIEAQQELLRFVEFLREFADRTHHAKEENILFRAMTDNGFPRESGPIAVMLMEHEEGRARVRSMKELGERTAEWSSNERELMRTAAGGFVSLLRQHIMKEDNVLYPMARQQLPAEAMAKIASEFERFETEEKAKGDHDRLWGLGDDLCQQYVS